MTEDRKTEVRAVLAGIVAAWNAGDATRYASYFTEDADYITFFGVNMPGRETIEASHRALFAGPLKGSTLTGDDSAAIRFVREDVAVVVSGGGSTLDGDEPDPDRASTLTYVLVREPDAWRVTSFQNTRRQSVPMPAPTPTSA